MSLLIILARVFSKKIDGLNEFFLASRNLPAWVATATFVASWIGAASTIGTIDKAFSQGLSAFWYMAIPSALSLFVITFCFCPARQPYPGPEHAPGLWKVAMARPGFLSSVISVCLSHPAGLSWWRLAS
ncbi:MAG: hypothetical protein R2857_06690 [Vampirovibrionales bacterium]